MYQLLKWISKIPIYIQLKIGSFLGCAFYIFSKRTQIIRKNIKSCFQHLDSKAVEKIVWHNCLNLGKSFFEIAFSFWFSNKKLIKMSQISGIEHIKKAKKQGKTIVFLPAHFTPMLLAGRILNLIEPLTIIYFEQTNSTFNQQMKKAMRRHQLAFINNKKLRDMIGAIKTKKSLWLPCDQDYGKKNSVFAPFFDMKNTATTTTPAKLAAKFDISFLPVFYYRKKNHYYLQIQPELKNFGTNNFVQDATTFNQMVQKHIKANIDQYLWSHRRFKTQPKQKRGAFYQ